MKRIFSSVLIGLVFLNVMGYYGLLLGLKYQHTRQMIHRFNTGAYDMTKTESLKVPLKAQGASYSEVFERVDGDFEQEGEVYRLIKQRFYRDTFHIVYIKDVAATELKHAIADYVKTFSDAPSEDGKQTTTLPLFIKEYFSLPFSIQHKTAGWEMAVRKETHTPVFINTFTPSVVHPPERISSLLSA